MIPPYRTNESSGGGLMNNEPTKTRPLEYLLARLVRDWSGRLLLLLILIPLILILLIILVLVLLIIPRDCQPPIGRTESGEWQTSGVAARVSSHSSSSSSTASWRARANNKRSSHTHTWYIKRTNNILNTELMVPAVFLFEPTANNTRYL